MHYRQPGHEFKMLLYKLAYPRMIMEFYVKTGNIMELIDAMQEEYPEWEPESLLDHPAWELYDD
jgi:hypothetical protein